MTTSRAALFLAVALAGSSLSSEEARAQLWSHLLLIHNFSPAWIFALNAVFWSIAVEVQLYLLYPLLWKLRARWGIAGALKFTLLLSIASRIIGAVFFTEWDKNPAGLQRVMHEVMQMVKLDLARMEKAFEG